MPVFKIILNSPPISKPRGSKGKFGNINHSGKIVTPCGDSYEQWRRYAIAQLQLKWKHREAVTFQDWVLVCGVSNRRNDKDNVEGAVLDILSGKKGAGILRTDTLKNLPRGYFDSLDSPKGKEYIYLWFVFGETKEKAATAALKEIANWKLASYQLTEPLKL